MSTSVIPNTCSAILFVGLRGAGKGATAKRLQQRGLYQRVLDVGAIVRRKQQQIALVSAVDAEKAKTSQLIADEHIDPSVKSFLMDSKPGEKYILDGWSRHIGQAYKTLLWQYEAKKNLGMEIKIAVVHLTMAIESSHDRRIGRAKETGRLDDMDAQSRENGVREFFKLTLPAVEVLRHNRIPCIDVSSETGIVCETEEDKQRSIGIVCDRVLSELDKIEFGLNMR